MYERGVNDAPRFPRRSRQTIYRIADFNRHFLSFRSVSGLSSLIDITPQIYQGSPVLFLYWALFKKRNKRLLFKKKKMAVS